jgi:hypothetical protein
MFRSDKMMKRVRDCPCSICGIEDGTVSGAHANINKGMGLKVSDALVAALCFRCHTILDQGKDLSREERRALWDKAYIRTMQYMIENGFLVVK